MSNELSRTLDAALCNLIAQMARFADPWFAGSCAPGGSRSTGGTWRDGYWNAETGQCFSHKKGGSDRMG